MAGSSSNADTLELQSWMERAASLGVSAQTMEDELAEGTGFGDAVRQWMHGAQVPNGMVRKITLNRAKWVVGSEEDAS